MAHFLGLYARLQEKQPALARCTQNEFILSLKFNISDAFRRIKTTKVSCLTALLSLRSDDQKVLAASQMNSSHREHSRNHQYGPWT